MKIAISVVVLLTAVPALAENSRQLDAHEHGVGTLNIAMDETAVAMEFEAPGADIVGFEYAAESDADIAAIDAAIATLGAPLDLFVLPEAAGCSVVDAHAELAGDDDHGHDDHDGGDQEGEDHDDHGDDDHGDDDHDEHAGEEGHTEFQAEYTLTCESPDALSDIDFAYFEAFPNALKVQVQMITASGAQAFEVGRDAPVLELGR